MGSGPSFENVHRLGAAVTSFPANERAARHGLVPPGPSFDFVRWRPEDNDVIFGQGAHSSTISGAIDGTARRIDNRTIDSLRSKRLGSVGQRLRKWIVQVDREPGRQVSDDATHPVDEQQPTYVTIVCRFRWKIKCRTGPTNAATFASAGR